MWISHESTEAAAEGLTAADEVAENSGVVEKTDSVRSHRDDAASVLIGPACHGGHTESDLA